MPHLIAPSMLSADFLALGKDVELVNNSQADWFHLDIMDGVFVPNLSYGLPIVKAIKKLAKKPLDVHLMIVDPDRYIDAFKKAGADILTVHYEACTHLHRTIHAIKAAGMKAGVSINPHTPVSVLDDVIMDLDVVLIMSVNPGFGGQSFIENTYKKLLDARILIDVSGASALIEVDGGVTVNNAARLVDRGANVLVAGSSVFGAENPTLAIELLKKAEITEDWD